MGADVVGEMREITAAQFEKLAGKTLREVTSKMTMVPGNLAIGFDGRKVALFDLIPPKKPKEMKGSPFEARMYWSQGVGRKVYDENGQLISRELPDIGELGEPINEDTLKRLLKKREEEG